MPFVEINGIKTHYEVHGSGPPILMMASGGFSSTIEKWSTAGVWKGVRPLETLTQRYTCIAYDRREAGESGGRVERVSWATYAQQAKGLLDHLGIPRAFVMGGCMGSNAAVTFAGAYPEATLGLVLHWPVGGPRWRAFGLSKFNEHLAYVTQNGLDAVVRLARERREFMGDSAAGLWAPVIANDEGFAESFAAQDPDRYAAVVKVTGQALFDKDTVPGIEPEELMALKVPAVIIPGNDPSHARSAARYLEECLPQTIYHDLELEEQTPERVRGWIEQFLDAPVGAGVV